MSLLKDKSQWIFDLDNTLYPSSCNLFAAIDARMTTFIMQMLSLDWTAAKTLQKGYFRQYGTTLCGLMTEHGMEPDAFLGYVHDIDISIVSPDPFLKDALTRLPGKKYIYTNGTVSHAERLLDRIGIASAFSGIFDIRAADFVPKPRIDGYHRLLETHGIIGEHAVMVEDLAHNLEPAARLGMATVWVPTEADRTDPSLMQSPLPAHVHYRADDLARWLAEI